MSLPNLMAVVDRLTQPSLFFKFSGARNPLRMVYRTIMDQAFSCRAVKCVAHTTSGPWLPDLAVERVVLNLGRGLKHLNNVTLMP